MSVYDWYVRIISFRDTSNMIRDQSIVNVSKEFRTKLLFLSNYRKLNPGFLNYINASEDNNQCRYRRRRIM